MRAPTKTIEKARRLRRNLSLPEARLWRCLKTRGLERPVFRRQHPIGPFVIDFYCARARLAVEIDGLAHDLANRPARDLLRDTQLTAHGITVLRIPAADLIKRLDETADAIVRMAEELSKQPSPLPTQPSLRRLRKLACDRKSPPRCAGKDDSHRV